jgi:hypothetical protein
MKNQLTQSTQPGAATAGTFERFATLDKLGRYIALARLGLAAMAGTAFWPFSNAGAILVFGFFLLVPIPSSFDIRLRSGRTLRKVTARSFFTIPALRKIMEVRYEACTDDYRSMSYLREEVEACTAVMEECEELEIDSADVIAVLPTLVNDYNLERTSSKHFEKVNGRWIDSTV